MEVVVRDATHGEWMQFPALYPSEASLRRLAWYTRAWFDLYLRGDRSAVGRLLADPVLDTPREEVLSSRFRSAAFLPTFHVDCPDLVDCVAPVAAQGSGPDAAPPVVAPSTPGAAGGLRPEGAAPPRLPATGGGSVLTAAVLMFGALVLRRRTRTAPEAITCRVKRHRARTAPAPRGPLPGRPR
jgi:hypothetical protein